MKDYMEDFFKVSDNSVGHTLLKTCTEDWLEMQGFNKDDLTVDDRQWPATIYATKEMIDLIKKEFEERKEGD